MSTQSVREMSKRVSERLADAGFVDAQTNPTWYLIVIPKVLLFGLIMIVPFLGAFYVSLHQWAPLAQTHPFVGLENYVQLLHDKVFWKSLQNTVFYAGMLLLFDVPIALGLALLLNMKLKGTRFYSAAIFLPVVTSWVVVSLIWTWIYSPTNGILNVSLASLGLPTYDWLGNRALAMPAVTAMSIWKHIGFNMVIFLAGLGSIPDHYYEAAIVDGANRWQRFRYITLPLLKPTAFFVIVVTMIFSFRVYTQVYVMTNGGPVHATYTLMYYFWEQGFGQFNYGYASAMAVVLLVIVFGLSILQQRTWGSDVEY
ncbi:sugar ABC transporter permease [Halogeometricum sp. S1BR25-6]|uniref:Sugar ABC transporter permease n=1 Tax=Halogeometricum salsisoli TaxID=2950536 RepID=A0ABU2GJZ4_9EURY|nr:sugar ABC transporter permease [Halogeometricum sp. S1BR25-6]MDS0301143.1 sugar ABC transporter permease [Halogeometricum sp. S1BR25-6]